MDFDKLDAVAQQLMLYRKSHQERETGHVYYHGRRVMHAVTELRAAITDDASHDDILRAAALFHDCGKGLEPHAVTGAALVREYLRDLVTPYELDAISGIILRHDQRAHPEFDIWTRLQQDADVLDHLGYLEVWMNINYSARMNDDPPDAPLKFYRRPETEKELAHQRSLLNFDVSKAIFDEKADYSRRFADRIELEVYGGYALPMEEYLKRAAAAAGGVADEPEV